MARCVHDRESARTRETSISVYYGYMDTYMYYTHTHAHTYTHIHTHTLSLSHTHDVYMHAKRTGALGTALRTHVIWGGGYMSYEEEDTCHMRRRTHVIWGGGYMSYEEEDNYKTHRCTWDSLAPQMTCILLLIWQVHLAQPCAPGCGPCKIKNNQV